MPDRRRPELADTLARLRAATRERDEAMSLLRDALPSLAMNRRLHARTALERACELLGEPLDMWRDTRERDEMIGSFEAVNATLARTETALAQARASVERLRFLLLTAGVSETAVADAIADTPKPAQANTETA